MPSFRLETAIAASVVDCFELSLSVDAHTASMGSSSEQAIAVVELTLIRPFSFAGGWFRNVVFQ